MFLLGITLLFADLLLLYKNKGFDLISLFCTIWAIVFLSASLKLYGMKEYSAETTIILGIASFCVVIFALLTRYTNVNKHNTIHFSLGYRSSSFKTDVFVNKRILVFFLAITTLFILYTLVRMLVLASNGLPLGTIHAMYLGRGGEAFYKVSLLNQLHSKVIIPCLYCFVPLIIYYLLTDFKNNWKFVLVAIADIALYTIATGARVLIIFLIADIFLILPYSKIILSKKTYNRIKKISKNLFVVLLIAVAYYTVIRKEFKASDSIVSQVFGEFYKYFSLCVPLSDYWFESIRQSGVITYGRMSLYSLFSLIEWINVQFFNADTFSFLDVCRNLASDLEVMQPIFKDARANAFVTYVFYFYSDFRMIGVIFFSSLWGILIGVKSKSIRKNHRETNILFYLLFAQTVSMSFSRWIFFDVPYLLAFLFMKIFFIKGKKNRFEG